MSETDDTDELLIIPPDFFLTTPEYNHFVDSDFIPYYNVVDTLITQVNSLENRINSIQTSSNVSLNNSSEEKMQNSMSRFRKFGSSEDLLQPSGLLKTSSESTQSTPQKPRSKFTLNSLPASPNVDKSHKVTSPKKTYNNKGRSRRQESNPMLGEVDNFISNVKLIKRLNASRNLESDFGDATSNPGNLDAQEVEEMLRDLESQYRKNEERIRDSESVLDINKPMAMVNDKSWQSGDNINSVPDLGFGMRKQMYPEVTEIYTRDKAKTSAESPGKTNRSDDTTSDSSQMTAFRIGDKTSVHSNAVNVMNMHKNLLDNGDYDFNLGLMSLSRMWNSSTSDCTDLPRKFQMKLQEEQLRRRHCEDTIKTLQNRVLELQERVAVAVEVDEAKDKAIVRFHECWQDASGKLLEMEKEKLKLEYDNEKLTKQLQEECENVTKKISHYEIEASKALNIAHSTQEKLSTLESNYIDAKNQLETMTFKYNDLQMKYVIEQDKCRQFPEIIAQKELELNENKIVLSRARDEVAQCKKTIEECQAELSNLRQECDGLKSELRNQRELATRLSEQKSKLIEEVNAHKSVEASLQDELNKTRDQLECNKVELKNFYQGQVELVVQNKLKEFQNQLDAAEKNLKNELSKKELSIARVAATHIQQIQDKYSLEIKLLEAKHEEELRLHQLQHTKIQKDFNEANAKLQRQQYRQSQMERQLQKFMENLKQDNTMAEMNSFRSKSYNNLEEILSWRGQGQIDVDKKGDFGDDPDKNSQLTYRVATMDTPVTSKGDKNAKKRENSIQETINMLLERKIPGETKTQGGAEESQSVLRDDLLPLYQRLSKDAKGKTPWK